MKGTIVCIFQSTYSKMVSMLFTLTLPLSLLLTPLSKVVFSFYDSQIDNNSLIALEDDALPKDSMEEL